MTARLEAVRRLTILIRSVERCIGMTTLGCLETQSRTTTAHIVTSSGLV